MNALQNADSSILEYEMSRLDYTIEKVAGILLKYNDHPHAYEYYSTMNECLIALSFAMRESKQMQRLFYNLKNRIENMENTLARLQREKAI